MLNDTHTQGMAELLVKVAMPCSVFMALMRPFSRLLLMESLVTFIIASVVYLLGALMGYGMSLLHKAPHGERPCWAFAVGFGNVGFMGIPVVSAVFGYEGLFYVAMALASFNLFSFTVGAWMFEVGSERAFTLVNYRLIVKNPALAATIVGFIFFLTGFRFPVALEGGISLIAGMTSPISMLLVGAILAKQRLKDALLDFRLLSPIGVKLVAIPILCWLVLRVFITNPLMLGVVVTLMAMPPAAATAIFAEQYGGDSTTAAKLIVIGTLVCVITVPLISLLF